MSMRPTPAQENADLRYELDRLRSELAALHKQIRPALIDAWEAGNCTGLDGWVGEDRGTQEPDRQAIYNRDRDVNKLVNRLFPDGAALSEVSQ